MTADWEIIHGDSLEVLRGMESGSVDAVVTDPPYSSGGLHIGSKQTAPADKYTSAGHWSEQKVYPDFSGDSCDQMTWIMLARVWMSECYRVAKEGSHFYTFVDWRQMAAAILSAQASGWQYRGLVVWDKGNTARAPYPGGWRHGAEFLVWCSKGRPWTKTGGKWEKGVAPVHSVIAANGVRNKVHMTEKPVDFLRPVIDVATPPGGLVLDPFCGSGSTGEAARDLGRRFIGIERSPEYVRIAQRRLSAETRTEGGASSALPAVELVDGQTSLFDCIGEMDT